MGGLADRLLLENPTTPTLRFALTGDTGDDAEGPRKVADRILDLHRDKPLSTIFLLGDNLYEKGDFDDVLRRHFLNAYSPIIREGVPVHAVLGNHDYSGGHMKKEVSSPSLGMGGRRYYALTYGNNEVTFFIMDSESMLRDRAQILWLRRQLATCRSTWRILLMHRPIFASAMGHRPSKSRYNLLMPILTGANGVDLVLAGHNHVYERLAPHRGILFVVAGSGGSLNHGDWPSNPESRVRYNQSRAFVGLAIQGKRLFLRAIDEDGTEVDFCVLEKTKAGKGELGPPPSREAPDEMIVRTEDRSLQGRSDGAAGDPGTTP